MTAGEMVTYDIAIGSEARIVLLRARRASLAEGYDVEKMQRPGWHQLEGLLEWPNNLASMRSQSKLVS
jgi:hypothetical protein